MTEQSLDKVVALTTVFRTPALIKNAYKSFRMFYPRMKLYIVNNSGLEDPCTDFIYGLIDRDFNTILINSDKNVGHGDGMCLGLKHIKEDYAFIFDSDVVFKVGGFLEQMIMMMEDDTYAIGEVLMLDEGGRNVPLNYGGIIVPTIFEAYALFSIDNYYKYHKFTKFGIPPFMAAKEIQKRGLSNKIIKSFPMRKHLVHLSGGTRAQFGDCEDIVDGFKGKKGDMDNPYIDGDPNLIQKEII